MNQNEIGQVHMMMNYLRGTYKVLEEEWQQSARSIGLTQAEQHALWIVSLEKEATITRISELGLWDVSTVMQVIKRLKEKGYIDVRKKETDRRVSYVTLTETGEEKIDESGRFSYKLHEYLKSFSNEKEENVNELKKIIRFHKDINQYFHGTEFVNWIEKTSDSLSK